MKDPKGHGSNSRGGHSAVLPANRRGIMPARPHREGTSNADAANALMSTLKSTQAPVHDSMAGGHGQDWAGSGSGGAAGGHGQDWGTNDQGHAWGSPEALADFKSKYGGPRNHAAEQRSFNSAKREIKQFGKRGR